MFRILIALAAVVAACLFGCAAFAYHLDPRLAVATACAALALVLALVHSLWLPRLTLRTALVALLLPGLLCLNACAGQAQFVNQTVQNLGPAIQDVVAQDVANGQIPADVGAAISQYGSAASIALDAYANTATACQGQPVQSCILTAFTNANAAGQQLLTNPAIMKAIGAAAPRVQKALTALQDAVSAAQDAIKAGQTTDASQKNALILAAVIQLNAAILAGVQAAAPVATMTAPPTATDVWAEPRQIA